MTHIRNIQNYQLIEKVLPTEQGWHFNRMITFDFQLETNHWNEERQTLFITFRAQTFATRDLYDICVKFEAVSGVTFRGISISHLWINDFRTENPQSETNYYVHDDSGYGEHDGFGNVAFHCQRIEVLSAKPIVYSEDF